MRKDRFALGIVLALVVIGLAVGTTAVAQPDDPYATPSSPDTGATVIGTNVHNVPNNNGDDVLGKRLPNALPEAKGRAITPFTGAPVLIFIVVAVIAIGAGVVLARRRSSETSETKASP